MSRKNFVLIVLSALLLFSSGCERDECSDDSDCDDGIFCNGAETCVLGDCYPNNLVDCNDNRACTIDVCDPVLDECTHTAVDRDGDGHFDPGCDGDDCDDANPEVYPGAEELCDGLDNDCDDIVNEDLDGDGHFDAAFCPVDGDDCDDTNPEVYPGAPEICDGVDNNCSGDTDDEEDTDGDGSIDITCSGGDDCDDEDPSVSPLAPEVCNGEDDNCDGSPDETFECVQGETEPCETTCGSRGTVRCRADCSLPDLPEGCEPPEESCNGEDDDCDGVADNDLPCVAGELAECTTTCGSTGLGVCTSECQPAAPEHCAPPAETCNGIDDNCNISIDEGFPCAAGSEAACETTCGTTGRGTCTDECTPAAPADCTPPDEICNDFIDNDCDGDIDCTDYDCIGDFACGGGGT